MEITLDVLTDTGCHDVSAEVTKLGPDDYVVIWADFDAVRRLGMPSIQLASLVKRCEYEARWLEWEREAEGITSLLDDVAPAHSHDRDHRPLEVTHQL